MALSDFKLAFFREDGTAITTFYGGRDGHIAGLALNEREEIVIAGRKDGYYGLHLLSGIPDRNTFHLQTLRVGAGASGHIFDMIPSGEGSYYLCGIVTYYDDVPVHSVFRLLPGGELDGQFEARMENAGSIRSICLDEEGRLLVGGSFTLAREEDRCNIARISPDDGSPLPGFAELGLPFKNHVTQLGIDPQGAILASCWNLHRQHPEHLPIWRILPNGAIDESLRARLQNYEFNGQALGFCQLENGRIFVYGPFSALSTDTVAQGAMLLNADGSIDTGLYEQVKAKAIFSVVTDEEGRLTLVGKGIVIQGVGPYQVVRLLPDWSPDPTFEGPFPFEKEDRFSNLKIARRKDGKYLLGGDFSMPTPQGQASGLVRLNADGAYDPTFSLPSGGLTGGHPNAHYPMDFALLPEGLIAVSGTFDSIGGRPVPNLAILDDSGQLAEGFENLGVPKLGFLSCLFPLDDQTLLVAGSLQEEEPPFHNGILKINLKEKRRRSSAHPSGPARPQKIQIFPNPTRDFCYLLLPEDAAGLVEVSLIGQDGKLLKAIQMNFHRQALELTLDALPAGAYTVIARLGERSWQGKVVKY
ncbi:MAG: hypothetical protein H6560_21875 [Lewinellaceae bacterium]|nr:hypothetical protein [Lewinellaceae bacterium]